MKTNPAPQSTANVIAPTSPSSGRCSPPPPKNKAMTPDDIRSWQNFVLRSGAWPVAPKTSVTRGQAAERAHTTSNKAPTRAAAVAGPPAQGRRRYRPSLSHSWHSSARRPPAKRRRIMSSRSPTRKSPRKQQQPPPQPTPPLSLRSVLPSLQPTTPLEYARSEGSNNTTATSKKTNVRERSPVKKLSDLTAARPRILIQPDLSKEPEEIKKLQKKLLPRRKPYLPACLKAKLLSANDEYDDQDFFPCLEGHAIPCRAHETLSITLAKIQSTAIRAHQEDWPEPSLGDSIYKPLLDLAVDLASQDCADGEDEEERTVVVHNITTLGVSPPFLPRGLNDVPLQSKRVDYGVFLDGNETWRSELRRRLEVRGVPAEELGVNATPVAAEIVRWLPQLLSIETKRDDPGGGVNAEAQLAVWMAGLKIRLTKLLRPSYATPSDTTIDGDESHDGTVQPPEGLLPPLPCVKVRGFTWQLYWCQENTAGEIVLYGPRDVGSTQELGDLFATVYRMAGLIEYMRDVYMPWAMDELFWAPDGTEFS